MRTPRWSFGVLVCALAAAAHADPGAGDGHASGHFRIGELRLDVSHAAAVVEDPLARPEDARTLVYLSAAALDAAKVAAAFDADDAVREQLSGRAEGYLRLCIDAEGNECGLFYSAEGFNSGGYGELKLDASDARRIAGSWVLTEPEEFFDKSYQFALHFDTPVTPAPGQRLPAGGGEPGAAYNAWLAALASGDLVALRAMGGASGNARFSEDDPTAAKEALKSLRDGQPLQADGARGLLDGERARLWVEGVDRDDIRRRGSVVMRRTEGNWRYEDSDLDSVDD